mmetsp:Transcript_10166/g.27715  ORF Transcript_10166/g.27715 Transcript_10166/m.27715 type:complete len:225 (-) Transcript_10166:2227-2901(-)
MRNGAALRYTTGPSKSCSTRKALPPSAPPPCLIILSSAAALRYPRPGTNGRVAPFHGSLTATFRSTPVWATAVQITSSMYRPLSSRGIYFSSSWSRTVRISLNCPQVDDRTARGSNACLASATARRMMDGDDGSSDSAALEFSHAIAMDSSAENFRMAPVSRLCRTIVLSAATLSMTECSSSRSDLASGCPIPTTSACGRCASMNSLNLIASLFFFGSSKIEYG